MMFMVGLDGDRIVIRSRDYCEAWGRGFVGILMMVVVTEIEFLYR